MVFNDVLEMELLATSSEILILKQKKQRKVLCPSEERKLDKLEISFNIGLNYLLGIGDTKTWSKLYHLL